MSGSSAIPNYRDTSFEYADLTVIHGEPTYETLKTLVNQLKANARSVRTTLGGGQHGYLGLVLSSQQYAIVAPNTPFHRPHHPGPLNIPPYQLPHVTQQIQATHAEQVRPILSPSHWTRSSNIFSLIMVASLQANLLMKNSS